MFIDELKEIKGIGEKTARDIIAVFPTREGLEKAISKGQKLPFRDDVERILIKYIKKTMAAKKREEKKEKKFAVCHTCHTLQRADVKVCPTCHKIFVPRE